jgi:hypothetical protein
LILGPAARAETRSCLRARTPKGTVPYSSDAMTLPIQKRDFDVFLSHERLAILHRILRPYRRRVIDAEL